MSNKIDPELLLRAYASGIFPMADSRDAPDIFWVEPKARGILPLDRFHLSRSLKKTLQSDRFIVTVDRAFDQVVQICAEPAPDRDESWINQPIFDAYKALFNHGFAHSVECWEGNALVGGLYGVSLGAAFFGESMFTRRSNASKVALAHLIARMKAGGFQLLDTQFLTPHLESLGAIEIPRKYYQSLLEDAVAGSADFAALDWLAAAADEAPEGAEAEAADEDEAPFTTVAPDDVLTLGRDVSLAPPPVSGKRIVQLLTQTS